MNTQPNDGGPAFPWEDTKDAPGQPLPSSGMTLRDYFAAAALQGYMTNTEFSMGHDDPDSVCNNCLIYADAMIAARERKEGDQ